MNIRNLALLDHGNVDHIGLGTDVLSVNKIKQAKKYDEYTGQQYKVLFDLFNDFKALLDLVDPKGSVVLMHCRAGGDFGDIFVTSQHEN